MKIQFQEWRHTMKIKLIRAAVTAACSLALFGAAAAQDFPSRPIATAYSPTMRS